MRRYFAVVLALAATVAAPVLLRPGQSGRTKDYAARDRLVVITPHVETIRYELEHAFQRWMHQRHGRHVVIDWRVPGGTSEIRRVIESEYTAAFHAWWESEDRGPVTATDGFLDSRTKSAAREAWLTSTVSSGLDVMLGGGPVDYDGLKRSGCIVRTDASEKSGPAAVVQAHRDWFTEAAIPAQVAGQVYYDPEFYWLGTCLSSFGICYNEVTLRARGAETMPVTWNDLAGPGFENQLALADPTKSGTVAAMFEVILQIEIQRALAELPPDEKARRGTAAIADGWLHGLQTIQRIGANARYWTDSSTKIPLDVAEGEALAGMCVDFYGRNLIERLERARGESRLRFVAPRGETTISPQPVAMFRGARNADLATHFIEFLLSLEGQKLWGLKSGTAGGPEKMALRNMPIRRDYYVPENLAHASDPALRPHEPGVAFTYEPKYTAHLFSAIREVIRVMCIDPHEELKAAWHALIAANFPPRATALFHELTMVNYANVSGDFSSKLKGRDNVVIARMRRDLSDHFRRNYLNVIELARAER